MAEHGRSDELMGVHAGLYVPDLAREQGHMFLQKWDADQTAWASRRLGGDSHGLGFIQPNNRDFARLNVKPYDEAWTSESNLITTAGWGRVLTLAIAGGGTAYDATHTRVGVGTATATASMTATDLAAATGSTNREWQLVTGVGTTGGATGSTAAQLTFVASFGTGNANIAWAEWCLTDDTEIMTAEGWRRHDQIRPGDQVLTMDSETHTSRWEPLLGVAVWPKRRRQMRLLEGVSHSSLSTLDHRWFVRQRVGRDKRLEWTWKTSRELNSESAIPRAVPCADLPTVPKYDDTLVELVGWFWTEGWITRRGNSIRAHIGQSDLHHPAHVAAIRSALAAQFPGEWHEDAKADGMVHFTLRVAPTAELVNVTGEGKAPTPSFIYSLTRSQLLLLIETALAGDGTTTAAGQRTWRQVNENGVRMFEMACALAGIPTNTLPGDDHPSRYGQPAQRVSLLKREIIRPVQAAQLSDAAVDEIIEYDGIVWCPQTPSNTWLARRRGSVYWTGNSIDQGTASGYGNSTAALLNRAVSAQGTKTSGQTWTATCVLSFT